MVGADVAIQDATDLGNSVAEYLIDPIKDKSDQKQRDNLECILKRFDSKYDNLRPFAVYPIQAQVKVNEFLPTRLSVFKCLADFPDPRQAIHLWSAAKGMYNDELMPNLEILNNRLGIVAPLSSDYLYAVLLHRFIQQHTNLPCFNLRPLIISDGWLDIECLLKQRDMIFEDSVDEIAIWTNIDNSYGTRITATRAIEELYPGKRIHGRYVLI